MRASLESRLAKSSFFFSQLSQLADFGDETHKFESRYVQALTGRVSSLFKEVKENICRSYAIFSRP